MNHSVRNHIVFCMKVMFHLQFMEWGSVLSLILELLGCYPGYLSRDTDTEATHEILN